MTENYHFSGAFLLVYAVAMFFCGVPIFFQEVAIGQYLGSGGMTLVAQLCPMLKVKLLNIDKKMKMICTKCHKLYLFTGCGHSNHVPRVLPGHLLLHHHRVDILLPHIRIHGAPGLALEHMWY